MSLYKRFNIELSDSQVAAIFLNRVYNLIFDRFVYNRLDIGFINKIELDVANALGERMPPKDEMEQLLRTVSPTPSFLENCVKNDFYRCLLALETIFASVTAYSNPARLNINDLLGEFQRTVIQLLSDAEVDLGVTWQKGTFVKKGAQLLDKELVNDPLDWLREKNFVTVAAPFEKGLKHLLQSSKNPGLLADVVTDMYEAVEGLAKIVSGRDEKDLSANKEKFISELNLSKEYKDLLDHYIEYANNFRHAAPPGKQKPALTVYEVESFVYLSGLFIRLVMKSSK